MSAYNAPLHAEAAEVEPAAPCPSHSAGDGAVIVCPSCGHENAAGVSQCERPTCRKVLPGNSLRRRTGLYATNGTPEMKAIEAEGERLVEESISKAGGVDQLTARERSVHQYRGILHVRIRKLDHALNLRGDFDNRDRYRLQWTEQLNRFISSALSIDETLGQGGSKIAPTLADALARAPEVRGE